MALPWLLATTVLLAALLGALLGGHLAREAREDQRFGVGTHERMRISASNTKISPSREV